MINLKCYLRDYNGKLLEDRIYTIVGFTQLPARSGLSRSETLAVILTPENNLSTTLLDKVQVIIESHATSTDIEPKYPIQPHACTHSGVYINNKCQHCGQVKL